MFAHVWFQSSHPALGRTDSKTSFKLLLCFSGTGQGLILSVGLLVNHGPKGSFISQKLASKQVETALSCTSLIRGVDGRAALCLPKSKETKMTVRKKVSLCKRA